MTTVGWFSQNLVGWENWDGWGWLGWLGNYPPVNGELGGDVGELVQWRWLGRLGWTSSFPVITRIQYDGFLWGNGVLGPLTGFRPGRTILECSRGGGQFGTVSKPSICWGIEVDGVGGGDTNGVGC